MSTAPLTTQTIQLPSGRVVTITAAAATTIRETPIVQWSVNQLYDELEHWLNTRNVLGQGRGPEAAHAREVAAPEIARIKRELRRRHLPTDRWLYEAELREQDARDERDTRASVLAASYQF